MKFKIILNDKNDTAMTLFKMLSEFNNIKVHNVESKQVYESSIDTFVEEYVIHAETINEDNKNESKDEMTMEGRPTTELLKPKDLINKNL